MASTPNDLRDLWRRTSVAPGSEVVLFYGHHDAAENPWFSNFFRHDDTPFTFSIPAWCGIYGGQETVPIEFSEKAIMLCKASLMGDADVFAPSPPPRPLRRPNALADLSSHGTKPSGSRTSVTSRSTSCCPSSWEYQGSES